MIFDKLTFLYLGYYNFIPRQFQFLVKMKKAINQQNVWQIRRDFPIFENNPNLVYFDNAASSQIPKVVVQKMNDYYYNYRANVGRTSGKIASKSDNLVENIRTQIAKFLGTQSSQIIWTSGSTESLNLAALSLYKYFKKIEIKSQKQVKLSNSKLEINLDFNSQDFQTFKTKSEVIIAQIEHHSNFLVWTEYFKPVFWQIQENTFWLKDLVKLVNKNTKILVITQVSNFTGQILPIKEIIKKIRTISPQICVILDGSQAVFNLEIDMEDLDCDFYCFSGHKILAPNGIGVLWAKEKWLKILEPPKFGGGMVEKVGFAHGFVDKIKQDNLESKSNKKNLKNTYLQKNLAQKMSEKKQTLTIDPTNLVNSSSSNLDNYPTTFIQNSQFQKLENSQLEETKKQNHRQQNQLELVKLVKKSTKDNLGGNLENKKQNLVLGTQNEIQIHSTWQPYPHSWEAGTPNIAGIIGLGTAIEYFQNLEKNYNLVKYKIELWEYLKAKIGKISSICIINPIVIDSKFWQSGGQNLQKKIEQNLVKKNSKNSKNKTQEVSNLVLSKVSVTVSKKVLKSQFSNSVSNSVAILTFYHTRINSFDLAALLANFDICLRSGSLCCQPFLSILPTNSVLRISLNFYNTKAEIDFFVDKLLQVIKILS